jgi:hypothetical protein
MCTPLFSITEVMLARLLAAKKILLSPKRRKSYSYHLKCAMLIISPDALIHAEASSTYGQFLSYIIDLREKTGGQRQPLSKKARTFHIRYGMLLNRL